MKKRSKATSKPAKARPRKALEPKGRSAPKALSHRGAASARETDVARLTRELNDSLKRETATADVLKVISRSAFDLQMVLDNASPELIEFVRTHPITPGRHTITARVALDRRTVHVADLQADPEYKYVLRDVEAIRTELGVPMFRGDDILGVFILYKLKGQPFTDKQIELVTTFAAQAVIAIENARLLNELRQRTADLSESLEQQKATSEVLHVISASPGDLQTVFSTILKQAVIICDAKFGTLYRPEGDGLRLIAAKDVPSAFAEAHGRKAIHPAPDGALATAVKTKRTVHLTDLAKTRSYAERYPTVVDAVEVAGVRTMVGVPMLKENELLGILAIFRQEVRPFTDKQIELVESFAAQAVIAIENARL